MSRHDFGSRSSMGNRTHWTGLWWLGWSGALLCVALAAAGCGSGDDQVDADHSQSEQALVVAGFTETLVANGISNPTAMEIAPDGRLFVCQQGGQLRIIKNGALLPTPFVSLTVNSEGERGLLGVTFDPNFASNGFVYVYYTATTPAIHNRISRFTANGDVAVPGSELVLMDLENLGATNHNGGTIHFGTVGALYVAVGENANGSNAQSINTRLGKILRLNSDGTIPADNPSSFPGIAGTTSGVNRAIWAVGLRNPFTFAVQPGTGRIFINDVGEQAWEEIDDGIAGRNYGWPTCEGNCSNPNFTNPLFAYDHAGGGCAITGGAFYNPTTQQFPSEYVGDYFFADYCAGWIRRFDPSTGAVTDFGSGISFPVDLKIHADGSLYYAAYGAGAVYRVQYTGSQEPSISTHPSNRTVSVGQTATFSVTANGATPLSYQWEKNGTNISGATSSSYTTPPTTAGDDGAAFRCVVSNALGSATSNAATLTVTGNTAPTATITAPANDSLYSAGNVINYSGTGTDAQDGTLPASAFTWQVDFGHDTHFHPFVPATSGSTGGSFTIPTSGETSANVFYRIFLTVRDSGGLTNTTFVDIRPRTSTITLASSPSGLQLRLDGQPVTTPFSVLGVQGMTRQLEAPSPQIAAGRTWAFSSWSDGGAAVHSITTPTTNTTYTATYQDAGPAAAFAQDAGPDGLVSIEAEHFDIHAAQGGYSWNPVTPPGASGTALSADPDTDAIINTGYTTGSPRLDYQVNFVKTGIHYIWVRGMGPSGIGNDDSCHAGLDGQAIDTSDRIGSFGPSLTWLKSTMDGIVATVNVASTGVHTINLWMREDGFIADKLVVTTNANFTPTGTGPAESPRVGSDNVPPTVSITSPANDATFTVPANISIAADASDFDGTVTKLEFFQGTTKLGEDLTSPYSFTWNNAAAGSYSLTAKATDNGMATTTSSPVNITVNGGSSSFQQDSGADGLIAIEAEHFDAQAAQGGYSWNPVTPPGASGTALSADPDTDAIINTGYTTGSPRLDYQVHFVKTGIHYIWVRGMGPSGVGNDDSCHAGLDGQAIDTADRIGSFGASLTWLKSTMDGIVATVDVASTGGHTINLWMREDGFIADKLVVTTNANFTPSGTGPAESPRGGGGAVTPTAPPTTTASATPTVPNPPTVTSTATAAPAGCIAGTGNLSCSQTGDQWHLNTETVGQRISNPSTTTVCSVTAQLFRLGTPAGTMVARLYADASGSRGAQIGGDSGASSVVPGALTSATVGQSVTFTWAPPVALPAGPFWLNLVRSTTAGGDVEWISGGGGAACAGGTGFNAVWTAGDTNQDFFYTLFTGAMPGPSGTPTRTPTTTPTPSPPPGGSFATDDFERASLGGNWTQFLWERGASGDWASVSIEATGHAAHGEANGDATASYQPFIPSTSAAYACIKSGGSDTSQNACACLGIDNTARDGLCCCFKNEGGPDEFEMFGWDDAVFVWPELANLSYSVGDFMGIERAGDTFQCKRATAAAPTNWLNVGSAHTVPGITNPGRGGVYFYSASFTAEQFEVGNGTLPATRTCGGP